MPKYCQNCGTEVSETSSYCTSCGASLKGSISTGDEPPRDDRLETDGMGTARTVGSETSVGGLEPNVAGALAYVLGFLSGLVIFLLEDHDQFVRFHAAQSMVVFGGLWALAIAVSVFSAFLGAANGIFLLLINLLFSMIWFFVALATFVLWIYLIVKAYKGETPRIPVAAGIADDLV